MLKKIKDKINDTEKNEFYFFCALFIAFLLKYMIYGFNCFYVLDDYIQYGGYPMYNDTAYVLFDIGTIATRPLASFLDIVFWGKLWDFPRVMFMISAAFHFLSCVIFYKAAKENNIFLSPIFAVFYLFFPLGSEGSMWISASSRIVLGLFFSSLAILSITQYEKEAKKRFYIVFLICAICSFTLYESCAVFCFLASLFVLIKNRQQRRFMLPFVSLFVMLLALLLYMKLGQNIGHMGTRALDSSMFLVFSQAGDFFAQLFEIMTNGIFKLTIDGFAGGLYVLLSKRITGILYLLIVFAVCVLIGKIFSMSQRKLLAKSNIKSLAFCGIVLFFAVFAPNLITEPVWITYRTMFVAMIGIYLILDILFLLIPQKSVQTVLLMVLLFIFTISSINEYDTYKRTNALDTLLLGEICKTLPEEVMSGEKEVAVLLDDAPQVNQVSLYKDHVKTVFHHDWSLTGAARAYTRNIRIKKVTPVYPDTNFNYSDCYVVDLRKVK